jgi:hypothetical protein
MKAHLDIEQWMPGHCMITFMSCCALPSCWFPYYLLRPARGEREDGLQIIC